MIRSLFPVKSIANWFKVHVAILMNCDILLGMKMKTGRCEGKEAVRSACGNVGGYSISEEL